jgi:8-oxo-dGTP pyrophosphatase MutT (NUDIX family)
MISDRLVSHPIVDRKTVFSGMVWDVRHDAFELNGERIERDYIVHPGAVAIIALNDSGELLLIEQYRHAQGKIMWEAPAGLMDLANEDPLETAKRELFEETGYVAKTWHVLLDLANTPGGSSEQIRIYFARDLSLHPDGRPTGSAEELDMPVHWIPIKDVLESIRRGAVTNPQLVAGTHAALIAMAEPDMALRSEDAPWHAREDVLATDRVWLPKK